MARGGVVTAPAGARECAPDPGVKARAGTIKLGEFFLGTHKTWGVREQTHEEIINPVEFYSSLVKLVWYRARNGVDGSLHPSLGGMVPPLSVIEEFLSSCYSISLCSSWQFWYE